MSNRIVVDTDVFSYVLKRDSRASQFARHFVNRKAVLSAMTLAEVRKWAIERRWGVQRLNELEQEIGRCAIAPLSAHTAAIWAKVFVARSKMGKPISVSDCWVAATALEFGFPLVTNNERDFQTITGLTVLGPVAT